jgi:hypothetical protein
MTDAKEMMSESLVDKFETDETFSFVEKVFLCSIDCIVSEKIETLVGIIEGFEPSHDDKAVIRLKASVDDAFSISEVWKTIRIKDYKLSLKGQIIHHEGIFKVLAYKVLNVDNDKSICSISLELVKE